MRRKGKLLLMLLFITGFNAIAQPEGPRGTEAANLPVNSVIKGKVVEKSTSQVMEYANISIFSTRDSTLVTGGITDENGEFRIGNLNFGSFYVEANFIGFYKTRINNIRITPDNRQIDLGIIKLEPSTQEIGAVEVVADKARVEYKVDKKVINVSQDINAAGGTAVDVLENTPSVQVDIEGNVTVRGSSNFTVFIDGRPSALSGSDALQQIPASALENIEIITNPSAKYDPDGMAGIINLVMKKNVLSGFNGIVNASIGTGDKKRLDMTLNQKTKKRNFIFGVDLNDDTYSGESSSSRETSINDTIKYETNDGSRDRTRSGYRFKGGSDFFLSDYTTLGFLAEYGKYSFGGGGIGKIHRFSEPASLDYYGLEIDPSEREGNFLSGNINFQHKFNKEGTHLVDATFYYRHRDGNNLDNEDEVIANSSFEPTAMYSSRIRTMENDLSDNYRFKADYTTPLGTSGKLEAGIQSRIDRESEDYFFEEYATETQEWVNNENFTSDMQFNRDIHAIYSTVSSKLGSFEYMLGLRGEYTNRKIYQTKINQPYTLNRFDYFPTGHISYTLFDESQLMASYSRRINRPRGRDLDPFANYLNSTTISIGNPDLEPEYTNSYEMSYMKRFGKSFISLEGFYRVTNNLITRLNEVRDDNILYQSTVNLNNDFSLGGELMANLNLSKWLLLNGSVSVYNYVIEDESGGQYIKRESTNMDGRLNTTVKFSTDSRLQLIGIYRGPSVSAQGDNKGMFYSNISYRQDFFNKKMTATLSLQDALGTAKREGSSSGSNFTSNFRFQREPRVFRLTLSYKINNFKMEKSNASETNEVDFGESE